MSQLNSTLPAMGAVAAHAKEFSKVQLRDLAGRGSETLAEFSR